MRKYLFLFLVIIFIESCKNATPDYSGNEKISADDFLKAFPQLNLPVTIADTTLQHFGDSLVISKTVFEQFIPDSAVNKFSVSSNNQLIIHPAGIIHNKERDFILATISSAKKINRQRFCIKQQAQISYIIFFNKQ